MSLTRMKAALQDTSPTKLPKLPIKEPSAQDGPKLDILDPGRYVLFKGRWYLPGVTVRPVFEFWNHKTLSSVEPKASVSVVKPTVTSLLSKNLLYTAASLESFAAYQVLKCFKERTLVAPVPGPANITTKQKIKMHLRTRNVDTRLLSLEEFLSCLGLQVCINQLQGRDLGDLLTLSYEQMAALGIRQDHIVQIKKGIIYLMDLHNKSFDVFPPVPNALNA